MKVTDVGEKMEADSCKKVGSRSGLNAVLSIVTSHFWLKCLGTIGFTFVFFLAYIYLLKHPAFPVTLIPEMAVDRLIGVEPMALPLYLSLWIYLSVPVMLMRTRKSIVEYGLWIGALCLVGLTIFYFWPTAIPPSHVDWAQYPGMAFLKGMDAAGNACPSLHVATAVFSCFWLDRQLQSYGRGSRVRLLNLLWCVAIVYSTMATKQHMAIDVVAGIALALFVAQACLWFMRTRADRASGERWIGGRDLEEQWRLTRPDGIISVRNVLLAVVGMVYLGVGYVATTVPHPPAVTILIGFIPLGAGASVAAWKSRARLFLMPLCIVCMGLVVAYLGALGNHIAWLYFIQHAGAMTLLGLVFGSTLGGRNADALCSRIATLIISVPLEEDYLHYTWKVTLAWTLYFVVSAVLSVTLFFFSPIKVWSIFADLLTPVTIGLMFVGEYLIRQRVFPDGPRFSIVATMKGYRAFTRRSDATRENGRPAASA